MIRFAEYLDDLGVKYLWLVFTNDTNAIDNPNIIFMQPDLEITSWIAKADFLIQLSKSEAYCYSVVEALSLGIPVIVTDLPVYNEIGLDDSNSIKLKQTFTKDDIDIDLLFKKYKFKYEPPTSEWDKFLAQGQNTWQEERKKRYKVKPTPFFCAETPNKKYSYELGRQPKSNDIFEVSHDRLQELVIDNQYEQPLVEVVKEIS